MSRTFSHHANYQVRRRAQDVDECRELYCRRYEACVFTGEFFEPGAWRQKSAIAVHGQAPDSKSEEKSPRCEIM